MADTTRREVVGGGCVCKEVVGGGCVQPSVSQIEVTRRGP